MCIFQHTRQLGEHKNSSFNEFHAPFYFIYLFYSQRVFLPVRNDVGLAYLRYLPYADYLPARVVSFFPSFLLDITCTVSA